MAGAPEGNDNRAKQYRIKRTLESVLDRRSKAEGRDALEIACEKLISNAENGDLPSFKEMADRLDGKPAQAVMVGNEDDKPFVVEKIVREIVRAKNPDG